MRLLAPSLLISLVTSLAGVHAMDLMLKAPDGNGYFMVNAAADDTIRTLKTAISKVAEIPVSGMFVMKEKEWLKEGKTLAEAGLKHMNEIWVLQVYNTTVEGVEEHLTSDRDRILVEERIPGMEDPVLVEKRRPVQNKPRKPDKPLTSRKISKSELDKKKEEKKNSETKRNEKRDETDKKTSKSETAEEKKKSETKKEEKKSHNPSGTDEKKSGEKDEL